MHDYQELFDHYYYENYNPIALIDDIKELPNNHYRIYLYNYVDNSFSKAYVDVTGYELQKMYNEYLIRSDRLDILKDRDIEHLVHFTKVDNLENILEYGLFSIDTLKLLDIDYSASDQYRFDNKESKISTSITYPNYKMFYRKRIEDPSQDWAIIKINRDLLLHKLDTEFYKTNAASSIYFGDNTTHNTNTDLENMFYISGRDMYIPKNYTTDPQAEVLVENNINTRYFASIETLGENAKVKSLTRDAHIDYNPESRLYTYRSDYARWR